MPIGSLTVRVLSSQFFLLLPFVYSSIMKSAALTLLSATLVFAQGPPLDIPIFGPLGGLKLTPGPDGRYGVGLHSGLNIGGNGFEKEFNFVGGPGTFETQSNGGVLVGGKSYGPNYNLGSSRQQGLQFGSEVDVSRTKYQNPNPNMIAFGGPQTSQQMFQGSDTASQPLSIFSFGQTPAPPRQYGGRFAGDEMQSRSSSMLGSRPTLPSRQFGGPVRGEHSQIPRSLSPQPQQYGLFGEEIRTQSTPSFYGGPPSTQRPQFGGLFGFMNQ